LATRAILEAKKARTDAQMPTASQLQANHRTATLSTLPNPPQGETIALTNEITHSRRYETLPGHPKTISHQPPPAENIKN
jgi:hypothetical protein